jgi:ATP-dependent DNA ligase
MSSSTAYLLFRREWLYFLALDVLSIDGEDVRALPPVQRKRRLARIMLRVESRLLLLEAIPARGKRLFELACERDFEGIVAKWSKGTYQCDGRATSWLKIKNTDYTQADGRHEWFAQIESGNRHGRSAQPALSLI